MAVHGKGPHIGPQHTPDVPGHAPVAPHSASHQVAAAHPFANDQTVSSPPQARLPVNLDASGRFIEDRLPQLTRAVPRPLNAAGQAELIAQGTALSGVRKGPHLRNLQQIGDLLGAIRRPEDPVAGAVYYAFVADPNHPNDVERGRWVPGRASSTAQADTLQNVRRVGTQGNDSVFAAARFETPEQATQLRQLMTRNIAEEQQNGDPSLLAMYNDASRGVVLLGEPLCVDLKIPTGNFVDSNYAARQASAIRTSNQAAARAEETPMDSMIMAQHGNGLGLWGAFLGILPPTFTRPSVAERNHNREANFDIATRAILTSARGVEVDAQTGRIDTSDASPKVQRLIAEYNQFRLGTISRDSFERFLNTTKNRPDVGTQDAAVFDALSSLTAAKKPIDKYRWYKPWTWTRQNTHSFADSLETLLKRKDTPPYARDTLALTVAHLREEDPLAGLPSNKSERRNAELNRLEEIARRVGKKTLTTCKSATDRTGYKLAQNKARNRLRDAYRYASNAEKTRVEQFLMNADRILKLHDAGGKTGHEDLIEQLRFNYFEALRTEALPNSEASTLINGLKPNDMAYLYLPRTVTIGPDGTPVRPRDPVPDGSTEEEVFDQATGKLTPFGRLFLGHDRAAHRGT